LEQQAGLRPQQKQEDEWCINQKYIAIDYLVGSFLGDVLAVIPFFLGDNVSPKFLVFRFFRLLRIPRILDRLDEFSDKFKDRYIASQIIIANINMAIKTMFIIGFVMHVLSCTYVFIGLTHTQLAGEYYDSWIQRYEYTETSAWGIYAASLIFTMNTVTTIGYGDTYSLTNIERLYTFFLIYLGMIVFAMIRQRIKLWKQMASTQDQLKEIEKDSLSFFYGLKENQPKQKKLYTEFIVKTQDSYPTSFGYYDEVLKDRQEQYKNATLQAFHHDEFFNDLPPKIREQVVEKCLEKQIHLLQFFFNDY
jgi:hypothetical protein